MTVQNEKSDSLYYQTDLLLGEVTNTRVNSGKQYESHLSQKLSYSITINKYTPLVLGHQGQGKLFGRGVYQWQTSDDQGQVEYIC